MEISGHIPADDNLGAKVTELLKDLELSDKTRLYLDFDTASTDFIASMVT